MNSQFSPDGPLKSFFDRSIGFGYSADVHYFVFICRVIIIIFSSFVMRFGGISGASAIFLNSMLLQSDLTTHLNEPSCSNIDIECTSEPSLIGFNFPGFYLRQPSGNAAGRVLASFCLRCSQPQAYKPLFIAISKVKKLKELTNNLKIL